MKKFIMSQTQRELLDCVEGMYMQAIHAEQGGWFRAACMARRVANQLYMEIRSEKLNYMYGMS